MSRTAFQIGLSLVVLLVLLSTTSVPGALIGVLCGVAAAFFVAPLTFLLQGVAKAVGLTVALEHVAVALVTLYGAAVLVAVHQIWRPFTAGDSRTARLLTLRAVFLAALPLVVWLSSQALVRAWR